MFEGCRCPNVDCLYFHTMDDFTCGELYTFGII